MTIEVTKQDIIWASGHYLSEALPSSYDEWSEKKLDKFLSENAWEFFEYCGLLSGHLKMSLFQPL